MRGQSTATLLQQVIAGTINSRNALSSVAPTRSFTLAAVRQMGYASTAPAIRTTQKRCTLVVPSLTHPPKTVAYFGCNGLACRAYSNARVRMPSIQATLPHPLVYSSISSLGIATRHPRYPPSRLLSFPSTGRSSRSSPFRSVSTVRRPVPNPLLARLEALANENPHNPAHQARLYKELLKRNYPELVISRFRQSDIAVDEECERFYQHAIDKLGQQEADHAEEMSESMTSTASASFPSDSTRSARSTTPSVQEIIAGFSRHPIPIKVLESNWGRRFRYFKYIVGIGVSSLICFTVMTAFIEGASILRVLQMDNENNIGMTEASPARFSDVHGIDEAKEELEEVVAFLKDPAKFTNLGGKMPKGVLLTGPPGTGKTLLARAVAGEAGVPFFFMSGSEFDEVFVGVGAKRVRELFALAKTKSPAIVFIDELDAVGHKRGAHANSWSNQTLNQLLVDLDGFEKNSGIVFIAATNFPELLDPALVRPGRFDKQVVVPLPDVRGRIQILEHYMKDIKFGKDVNTTILARGTAGFSGADLANLVNQAAIRGSWLGSRAVSMQHLEWAKDKIMMGSERKSMIISEKEKWKTAIHEAGHAVVSKLVPDAMPLHKVTIIPRGNALGLTHSLPDEDHLNETKHSAFAQIAVAMGGRVAEELEFDELSSGAASDFSQATRIARAMVCDWGMSATLGPVHFRTKRQEMQHSEKVAEQIDEEIRTILVEQYGIAKTLLQANQSALRRVAKALMVYETLEAEEVGMLIDGKAMTRTPPSSRMTSREELDRKIEEKKLGAKAGGRLW
ncbi:Mitochondrial inner membrane i-AAA protease supercomplex subunit YME1 [Neolecta irregularis DAH-3]|uniref:Mitochondrial inner membrane i-AAA protease supercomplex subunit YME1 n=1 Tax=Neolecta irregularis (strain DAH-3) TaxID=1198029 RepID=A0A1U7LPA6_NEOID|nr:Mitochondrial inner membrane i-AAA protease supercomplex subunit YME1 [Neolecta irregularis DAH-3]|eukprot:OLL24423.1 Mitochondrial inner membrane i-AAA protease supercomplex subunit YME1 [Neolecta irregularis DAH-3]